MFHRDVKRALLVVAHPDDEAMFFTPTIQSLQGQCSSIVILCLSNGEAVLDVS